jgi:hypothetical protein
MALTKIPASLLDTSSGFDLQGNITLGDSEKIRLGAGPDLDIYHDGSNSYIEDLGDGVLFVKASGGIYFNGKTTDEPLARFIENGAVNLYYDNDLRIATSSAGATVDGTLTVTGDLDITGNVNSYNVTDLDVTDQTITLGAGQTEANSGGSGIIIDGSSASILWDETNDEWDFNKKIHIGGETYFDAGTRHYTYDDQANFWSLYTNTDDTFRFNYNGSGDDEIVINTSGNVGIGETSPDRQLHLTGSGTNDARIKLENTSASYYAGLVLTASAKEFHVGVGGASVAAGYANSLYIHDATAGALRATIDTSGNVGIGTTPKAYHSDYKAIDINNSASVMGYTGNNGAWLMENLYIGTDGNWKHKNSDFSALVEMYDGVFNVYNTASGTAGATATLQNRLKIDASGNLLVGNTVVNPASGFASQKGFGYAATTGKVEIATDANAAVMELGKNNSNDGSILVFRKQGNVVGSIGTHDTRLAIGSDDTYIMFDSGGSPAIWPSNGTAALGDTIDIGDTTRRFKDLYLSGRANVEDVVVTGSVQGAVSIYSSHAYVNNRNWRWISNLYGTGNWGGFSLERSTGTGGTPSEAMFGITLAGLVGIGVGGASGGGQPSAKLHIKQSANKSEGDSHFRIEGSGYSGFHWLNGTAYYIGQNSNGRQLRMYSGSNAAVGVYLTNGGNSWASYSDERLKENITDIGSVTEKIKDIRCVTYNRKDVDDENKHDTIGFIAQDFVGKFDQVLDESKVLDSDEETRYSIRYTETIPILMKAIQEQQTIIDDLKARIEALEE